MSRKGTDAIAWNIGCVRASVLKDLGQDEWRKYLCVEAGAVGDKVMVPMSSPTKHSELRSKRRCPMGWKLILTS